jgi:hypothetical protein
LWHCAMQGRSIDDRPRKGLGMKKYWVLLFVLLMIIPAYADGNITFENYLKSFDYQERSNMKTGEADRYGMPALR